MTVLRLTPTRPVPRCDDQVIEEICADLIRLVQARRIRASGGGDPHDLVAEWTSCHAATCLDLLANAVISTTPDGHAPLSWCVQRIHQLRAYLRLRPVELP